MSRIAYVNGQYRPHSDAAIHIEDRGFQFADGVYEVVYMRNGRLIDRDLHMDRLDRSLRELSITQPMSRGALLCVMAEVARQNRLRDGLIYMQITRGTAARNHVFPKPGTPATLVVTMRRTPAFPKSPDAWAVSAITHADERWARCDIKSVALLPNVLAREAARTQGAAEAILFDANKNITEGAATTAWMVDAAGTLITRPLSHAILPGCTRAALLAELATSNVTLEERLFTLQDLRAAREIFITAATTFVKPVTKLDGVAVGEGRVGAVTRLMFDLIARHVQAEAAG